MNTAAPTFKSYFAQGKQTETTVTEELTRSKVAHREVTDLSEQHSGDFFLENQNVYVECKNDLLFSKYGNVYFEIGEIRDENAPKDPETIKAIGVLKHAAKDILTVIVHQLGPDTFIVYSARKAAATMMKEDYCLKWNEKTDTKMDRSDKTNIGILWKNAMRGVSLRMDSVFLWTDRAGLIKTVAQAAKIERNTRKASPKALITLAKARGRADTWRENGWSNYSFSVDGLNIPTETKE